MPLHNPHENPSRTNTLSHFLITLRPIANKISKRYLSRSSLLDVVEVGAPGLTNTRADGGGVHHLEVAVGLAVVHGDTTASLEVEGPQTLGQADLASVSVHFTHLNQGLVGVL